MTMKRDGRGRMRDYKKEYDRDHSSKDDKKDRASRNAARKKLKDFYESRGRKLAKNKDVDHKDGNPRNNKALFIVLYNDNVPMISPFPLVSNLDLYPLISLFPEQFHENCQLYLYCLLQMSHKMDIPTHLPIHLPLL